MQNRYRMYRRNSVYYAKDKTTGKGISLATTDRHVAEKLIAAKNQTAEQPYLNRSMAKVYLSAQSPELLNRTWSDLLELMAQGYKGATACRWKKFQKSAPIRLLLNLPLYQTEAVHFLAVLDHKKAGVSTNVWLRILHNRAVDLGWILSPVMPKKLWPKVQYKVRRSITADEHTCLTESERMADYRLFFELLWETGGSQSDVAALSADNIDWSHRRLYYSRCKLRSRNAGKAALAIGDHLAEILRQLPSEGALFPRLSLLSEDERASHFRKLCIRTRIQGVTLHSYRYSWAERACSAGMPEREAQAHLGHGSTAIHRAYARNAAIVTLSLEHYEQIKNAKLLPFAAV